MTIVDENPLDGLGSSDCGGVSTPSAQPNVPGRGIVAGYGIRFWALVVLIGVAAGLAGAGLIEILRFVQHLAWSYHSGDFLDGVERTSAARRLLVLAGAGVLTGVSALGLARLGGGREVSEAIWLRAGRLPFWASLARAVHSIVIVALGASLGREAAPQQAGAAVASALSDRARLPEWQRRLLVACGAGAGMAAVYNVPLGGALFAIEVLLGTLTLPLVLPALATTLTATAVAWLALGDAPTYTVPAYSVSGTQIVWALIVGPIAGFAAVAYIRLIARAHALRPTGRWRVIVPIIVFSALGAVAIAYPQILGNGRNVVQLALVGQLGVVLLAVLLVLKPLATAACLGSGAPGGLFTPTLAFGALLGGLLGQGWSQIWPGAPLGSYAIIGGAAVLAAAMQGPLAAIVLLLELTRHADALMVPILLAVVEATVVTRLLGAPSIYSARISAPGSDPGGPREPAALLG
ncbi:MAG: chloride channel protein [Solirubrobacteraceae bacterium]|jgi:H+/Cl- antiporter ClcA